ncbi:MAG: sigma-70 family RNA polymerase sigma factor [Armatimonadetes bacterium]|nr:sigma-70 family RNA polymerase sigma factor [Armatimonadota bacterium]
MVDDAGRERVPEGGIDKQGAANLSSDVDPEGFEALVDKYHRRIFNVIYRYVGDYYEAYDLTQDTFLRAYQSFQQFRGESTAYTWLYRIAINLSHNRIKQLKRKARSEAESLDDPIDVDGDAVQREVADWSMSPERVAESKELQGVLQRAIQSLPENYRAVILLRDVEGLSYQDIAKATGSSVEAVKSRLFRARSHLKGLLEPYLRGEV